MDNIYKAVQLTIDSQNLALSKTPTHVYIANQYVDTNDTPLITAPFIIQKALKNGTGVVDIVSSTIGSIYEVRLLCDAEVLISGYFYMPPMNAKFSELELYTSYPPRTPPVVNEFWQKTENFILEKTNSLRLSLGYPEELLTTKKSNLVSAINEVVSVKADKATTLVGYGISDAYTKSEIDTNYGGVKTLYDKNAAAGAGANGWTSDLVAYKAGTQTLFNNNVEGLESIADLLGLKPRDKQRVYVKSYHAGLKKGGGWFYFDSVSTLAVNGGTVLAANDGTAGRWLRQLADNEYITPQMFGAKADGVTDDYNAIMAAINSQKVADKTYGSAYQSGVVYFPISDYYVSQALNLTSIVTLKGEQTAGASIIAKSRLLFANNVDAIIVNTYNSSGATGTSGNKNSAVGSVIEGLSLSPKSPLYLSAKPLDINATTLSLIAQTTTAKFASGDTIIERIGVGQSSFSAVVSSNEQSTHTLDLLNISGTFTLGETITGGTSGATAKVVYVAKSVNAISVNTLSGNFSANETITGGTSNTTAKVKGQYAIDLTVYKLSSITGETQRDVAKGEVTLTKNTAYGSGVIMRSQAIIRDCQIWGFANYGIAGLGNSGNLNNFRIERVTIQACGLDGIYTVGGDANAGSLIGIDVSGCGGYGIRDNSFLGNHYFGCHTSYNMCGAYQSAIYNNFSVFVGCYSEGLWQQYPYYTATSKFGRDTTTIGGDHGAGIASDYYITPASYLNGHAFNVSRALKISRDTDGTVSSAEMNFNGASPTFDLINHGGEFGYSAFIRHFASYTYNYEGIPDNRLESADVGKYGIIGDIGRSGNYQLYLSPVQPNDTGISVTGGGATTNAIFKPVIVGGVITKLEIAKAGVGYTSPPTITGTGLWAGLTATADVANGKVVNVTVTNSPSGLVSTTPVLTLSVRSDRIAPNLDNTMSLGLTATRFKQGFINDLRLKPSASVTPSVNGEMAFELTNDTTLKVKVKGSDGVVRSATLTLNNDEYRDY